MQLILPLRAPDDPARRMLSVGKHTYPVSIARHRRARRFLLRVCPDGSLRLTVPRGAAIADGLRFAATQGDWIERERARQRQRAAPWVDGSTVWFRGVAETLRVADRVVAFGAETLRLSSPGVDLRRAV